MLVHCQAGLRGHKQQMQLAASTITAEGSPLGRCSTEPTHLYLTSRHTPATSTVDTSCSRP